MKTKTRKFIIPVLAGGLAIAGMTMPAAHAKGTKKAVTTQKAKITAAQAEAVTLRKFPGKIVAKTTLENEEGKWQYGVMVRSGHTLYAHPGSQLVIFSPHVHHVHIHDRPLPPPVWLLFTPPHQPISGRNHSSDSVLCM